MRTLPVYVENFEGKLVATDQAVELGDAAYEMLRTRKMVVVQGPMFMVPLQGGGSHTAPAHERKFYEPVFEGDWNGYEYTRIVGIKEKKS